MSGVYIDDDQAGDGTGGDADIGVGPPFPPTPDGFGSRRRILETVRRPGVLRDRANRLTAFVNSRATGAARWGVARFVDWEDRPPAPCVLARCMGGSRLSIFTGHGLAPHRQRLGRTSSERWRAKDHRVAGFRPPCRARQEGWRSHPASPGTTLPDTAGLTPRPHSVVVLRPLAPPSIAQGCSAE